MVAKSWAVAAKSDVKKDGNHVHWLFVLSAAGLLPV
jgi:hypothetical protein